MIAEAISEAIPKAIQCSACSGPLPPATWNSDSAVKCSTCGRRVWVRVFPAIKRVVAGQSVQRLGAETEACCFYHSQNRAERPCEKCGRFLCTLCQLEAAGRTLCPVCFQESLRGGKIQQLESSRTMYDSIALSMAVIPALVVWPTVISAPLTLYWVIRHWNSPRSIVPRTRIRFYVAGLFAISQIAFIIFVAATLWTVRHR